MPLVVFALVGAPAPAGAVDAADDQVEAVKVKGAGVSLNVPSNWVRVDPSKKEWAKSLDEAVDINPEAKDVVTADAVDPEPVQGGTNNVNVSIGDGVLLARARDYAAMLRRSLPQGWTVIDVRRVTAGTHKAFRARIRAHVTTASGSTVPVYTVALTLRGGATFMVTYVTVSVVDSPSDRVEADTIIRSIRPL
jgi:hypothetical protein